MWRIPITNRIQKFNSAGGFQLAWGSYGSGEGQFRNPSGVAVDGGGNVYVADTDNNRIQKFNAAGDFQFAWGSSGTGNGQFNNPSGVAVDSGGNVYVADSYNNRIQKFNAAGDFQLAWGSYGYQRQTVRLSPRRGGGRRDTSMWRIPIPAASRSSTPPATGS